MAENFSLQMRAEPEVDLRTAMEARIAKFVVERASEHLGADSYFELVLVRKQFATYLMGSNDPLHPDLAPIIVKMIEQFRGYPLHHCRLCAAISPCHLGICAWGCGTAMMWPRA